jgi:hypothetical protein
MKRRVKKRDEERREEQKKEERCHGSLGLPHPSSRSVKSSSTAERADAIIRACYWWRSRRSSFESAVTVQGDGDAESAWWRGRRVIEMQGSHGGGGTG